MQVTFKILKEIAVIKTGKNGWKKELNFISWNDKEPKYDIRWWSKNRKDIGKGMTFTPEEFSDLVTVVRSMSETKSSIEEIKETVNND